MRFRAGDLKWIMPKIKEVNQYHDLSISFSSLTETFFKGLLKKLHFPRPQYNNGHKSLNSIGAQSGTSSLRFTKRVTLESFVTESI